MRYPHADECRKAGLIYHLVPENVWDQARHSAAYVPEAFETDGFIHCTNGLDPLLIVGNTFYRGDSRSYMVLILKTDLIESEVRYDDADELFPHIYGPLNVDSVIGELNVARGADGSFTGYADA